MKRKIVSLFITIITLVLVLATITPTAVSFTPVAGLDPIEGNVNSAFWQFKWGVSPTYGVYLRDVNWNSVNNGWNLYAGMINVPWVRITDGAGITTQYDVPGGSVAGPMTLVFRGCAGGPQNYNIVFAYTFPDANNPAVTHWLEICFDIQHMPNDRAPPNNPLPNGLIHCWAYHSSNFAQQYTFEVAWRVDLDIVNAGNDFQDFWQAPLGGGPPVWNPLNQEGTQAAVAAFWTPVTYDLEVRQTDPNFCPWAGIEPYTKIPSQNFPSDTYYYVMYRAGEYKGNPANHIANGDPLNGQDDLFWWLAQNTNQGQRSNAIIWINVWLW